MKYTLEVTVDQLNVLRKACHMYQEVSRGNIRDVFGVIGDTEWSKNLDSSAFWEADEKIKEAAAILTKLPKNAYYPTAGDYVGENAKIAYDLVNDLTGGNEGDPTPGRLSEQPAVLMLPTEI